ncbi:MAG TPA: dioxygenase [Gammaproteobacteria bacterium]|nr:dioxygenase [Gammaproteobacteria bacterium]
MNKRVKTVVEDLVEAINDVLIKHEVTFDEYRAGFMHLLDTCSNNEMGLLLDMLFNQTICDIEMKQRQGTRSNVEGPYFLEGAPWVTDKVKVRGEVDPLLIRGAVKDLEDKPVPDVEVDLWWSDPEGYYSGYTEDYPIDYFRCKLKTNEQGKYTVLGSVPEEYPITSARHGPTGSLVEMLGGQSMRPKHIHQKYRKQGFKPLTTQAYFRGGEYLDEDPVKAVFKDLMHDLKEEDGVKVLDLDIILDPED